jgi:transcriptional regulator with XRE-family HTH domain
MVLSEKRLAAAAARKDREQRLRDYFANKLNTLRLEKGWSQSDLAREAAAHMPKGPDGKPLAQMGRDSVSNYLRGKTKPRPEHLEPLAKALGVSRDDLYPPPTVPVPEPPQLAFRMERQPNGSVLVEIHEEVPLSVAIEIMKLLDRDAATEEKESK